MITHHHLKRSHRFLWISIAILVLSGTPAIAQEFSLTNGTDDLLVTGTSTLHDWETVSYTHLTLPTIYSV